MRHRMGMATYTGLGGNSSPVLLDNEGALTPPYKKIIELAFDTFPIFKDNRWADFGTSENEFKFGQEPAYFGDDLFIISINKDKSKSFIQTGHAFGMYGSGIRSETKYYKDYKTNGKFKKFIDKSLDLIPTPFNK